MKLFAAICVLALGIGAANAATVTYYASGYWFGEGPFLGDHLDTSGTLTVDPTTGEIIPGGADVTVAGIATFNFVAENIFNSPGPGGTQASFVLANLTTGDEMFIYVNSTFLNGNTPILPTYAFINDQQGNELAGNWPTGQFSTPIPAALPLFATGFGALGLLGWRKKRKNAASIAAA